MLTPSDISTVTPQGYTQAQLDSLESEFDAALTLASESGRWPATVRDVRDAMPIAAVEEMARRYREVGWIVMVPRTPDVRAQIFRRDSHG